MATTVWEFLEPWIIVLYDSLMEEATDNSFSFACPSRPTDLQYERICYLWIPVDGADRQRLREAMELFTVLSVVNNRAFADELPMNRHTTLEETQLSSYPTWELCPVGGLSCCDTDAPVTWSTLLGFPDEYSPEFRLTLQRLEAMGLDGEYYDDISGTFSIMWSFEYGGLRTSGDQKFQNAGITARSLLNGLRKLLNTNVPPIVQQYANRGRVYQVEPWWMKPHHTQNPCDVVCAAISNTNQSTNISEIVSALTGTVTSFCSLSLGGHGIPDSSQTVTNEGILLSAVLCGKSLGKIGELSMSCFSVSNKFFSSICSAVADSSPDVYLSTLDMHIENSDRWSWLVYALCCGASTIAVPSVKMTMGTLTKSVISSIAQVLRVGYPQPTSEVGNTYGFVNIQAGVKVQPCGFSGDDKTVVILPSDCCCRAHYDPANSEWVNVIVPGYGKCKAKLGDAIEYTPDSATSRLRTKRFCGSMAFTGISTEAPELLMELLTLVATGLHTLKLINWDVTRLPQLDLRTLSAACPKLQVLETENYNVVVSAHANALRQWSIKQMSLQGTQQVSDLIPCLSDPTLRSSRKLVKLKVTSPRNHAFDKEEVKLLTSHDGEFLPVIKEKFPILLKTAMISVVTRADSTKAIHCLDACILKQRVVRYIKTYF
ncbi:Hypothetical protein PHPALM_21043 [Phytophthora palmivora]|uniref:Uncharacterized protein n=1 Tax=Phytophthora palmivora TaxID=4796 RepID=A0A2P4XDC7_9STRA|nr:Hypothetical protein PHPALM_21043 [Phytophthora palmivora]